MLYQFNGKIYVKPFSYKMVEVEVSKKGTEYDVKPTKKTVEVTPEIKGKLIEITLKEAYEKQNKVNKNTMGTI